MTTSKKIGISTIGHIDHGKTTLSAALAIAIIASDRMDVEIVGAGRNINEIIEEQKTIKFTAPREITPIGEVKSGKESRRERRAKLRKSKK